MVIRATIDIVVVLPMSTRWTPMLPYGFNPDLRQYASSVHFPCGLVVVVYEI